jgi:hypothetical protein
MFTKPNFGIRAGFVTKPCFVRMGSRTPVSGGSPVLADFWEKQLIFCFFMFFIDIPGLLRYIGVGRRSVGEVCP